MATALVDLTPSLDTTLVAAVAGKIIRLHQIITSVSTNLVIKSGATALTPTLKSGNSANVNIRFESPLQTARGEALVGFQESGAAAYPTWIVYDVVD